MKSSHASAGGRVGTGEIGSLTQLNLRQDLPAPQNYAATATTSFRQAASRVEIGCRIRCVSTEKVPGSQRAVPGRAGERQIAGHGNNACPSQSPRQINGKANHKSRPTGTPRDSTNDENALESFDSSFCESLHEQPPQRRGIDTKRRREPALLPPATIMRRA
jgi:hypothetical protein